MAEDQPSGNVYPMGVPGKGLLVRIERTQGVPLNIYLCIKACIVLVTKRDAGAGLALPFCFVAVPADWFYFVAFEFTVTASQAGRHSSALVITPIIGELEIPP